MRRLTEWGGGPEIVVLANVLRRPIHVYELQPPDELENGKEARRGGTLLCTATTSGWKLKRIACFGSYLILIAS